MELSAHALPKHIPLAAASTRPSALALWHLLSLDAPTVATLWTWFVAKSFGLTLHWVTLTAMFLAVWLVYATDRLLDARALSQDQNAPGIEARHRFHHVHRAVFRTFLMAAALALLALLPAFPTAELKLYLALGLLLATWCCTIHFTRQARLPKELMVGIFFAAAIFIPAFAQLHQRSLLIGPAALFAALCTLNCLFIDAWEHPHTNPRVLYLAAALLVVGLALMPFSAPPTLIILAAILLSASFLAALHLTRHRFAPTTLRALADLVLLTPFAVVAWLA